MAKRSDFQRIDKDKYYTFDPKAGEALRPFLARDRIKTAIEPFVGGGDLMRQFPELTWVWQSDISPAPQGNCFKVANAFDLNFNRQDADAIVTNTPWARNIFHLAITHFAPNIPCWFLIDSNWFNTKQSAPYIKQFCTDIVVIGRLRWIPDTKMSGKDDCSWARFSADKSQDTRFYNERK